MAWPAARARVRVCCCNLSNRGLLPTRTPRALWRRYGRPKYWGVAYQLGNAAKIAAALGCGTGTVHTGSATRACMRGKTFAEVVQAQGAVPHGDFDGPTLDGDEISTPPLDRCRNPQQHCPRPARACLGSLALERAGPCGCVHDRAWRAYLCLTMLSGVGVVLTGADGC